MITGLACCFQLGAIIFTGLLVFIGVVDVGFILAIANLSGNFLMAITALFFLYPQICSGKEIIKKFNIAINDIWINNQLISTLTVTNLLYQIGNKTILNNINFVLKKGEKLLVSGDSGAGKSTLLNILFG